jgi:hypothetical protein
MKYTEQDRKNKVVEQLQKISNMAPKFEGKSVADLLGYLSIYFTPYLSGCKKTGLLKDFRYGISEQFFNCPKLRLFFKDSSTLDVPLGRIFQNGLIKPGFNKNKIFGAKA